MIDNQNSEYDFDYQLLLTSKSKDYKANSFSNSTRTKKDFIYAFNKDLKGKEKIETQRQQLL